jgi:hypothetical protein
MLSDIAVLIGFAVFTGGCLVYTQFADRMVSGR